MQILSERLYASNCFELCPFIAQEADRQADRESNAAESDNELDVGQQILGEMKNFGDRLKDIESKVQDNQNAIKTLTQTPAAGATAQTTDQVIPTLAQLQQSPAIQRGMDERLQHLASLPDSGKYKSQREGYRDNPCQTSGPMAPELRPHWP